MRMPRMRGWLVVLAALITTASTAQAQGGTRRPGFPHARHAKLFPTCAGCHAGIATGDSAATYPPPSLCARCHDGTVERRVSWSTPSWPATNLEFSHVTHERASTRHGDTLSCARCHSLPEQRTTWMAVGAPRPSACFTCHEHRTTAHFAETNPCTNCHVPLVRATALSAQAIADLPRPRSHDSPDFLFAHAPTDAAAGARCATCHARESCERCHVNADLLPTVAALGRDPRVAQLAASRPAVYPVPRSHRDESWASGHAAAARGDVASCANCHAQSSCTACHIGAGGAATIRKLPRAEPGKAQGVMIRRATSGVPGEPQASTTPQRPRGTVAWRVQTVSDTGRGGVAAVPTTSATPTPTSPAADTGEAVELDSGRVHYVRVHPPGFVNTHGPVVATGGLTCGGCHAQRFCTDCHDGETRRRFHPANFIARHATEAFGRESDCARCHNPEAFCRSCHVNVGQATRNPRNAAFHTRQPLWLLQHGQAARQSLESCASCHQQRDCLRCHSTLGQRVNPHGPGFDAKRMAARNKLVCRQCHIGDPLAPTP
jgi:hypothetical protein